MSKLNVWYFRKFAIVRIILLAAIIMNNGNDNIHLEFCYLACRFVQYDSNVQQFVFQSNVQTVDLII